MLYPSFQNFTFIWHMFIGPNFKDQLLEMWLQRLMREVKDETKDMIKMCRDSQEAINIAKNPVHHGRT